MSKKFACANTKFFPVRLPDLFSMSIISMTMSIILVSIASLRNIHNVKKGYNQRQAMTLLHGINTSSDLGFLEKFLNLIYNLLDDRVRTKRARFPI